MSVTKFFFFIILGKSFGIIFCLVELTSRRIHDISNRSLVNDIASGLLSNLRSSLAVLDNYSHVAAPHERSAQLPTTDSDQFSETETQEISKVYKNSNGAGLIAKINDLLKELLRHDEIDAEKKWNNHNTLDLSYNKAVLNDYYAKDNPVISNYDSIFFNRNETLFNNYKWKEPKTRRIFKGLKSRIKDFPFMASISMFGVFYCAGSIIKADLILTAASCLQLVYNNRFYRENPKFLTVRVGSSFTLGGGDSIDVLEVYFYPSYDPKSLRNNIAIMRLERQIFFKSKNKRVKRIHFDRNSGPLPFKGDITVLGWGARTASNKLALPVQNILQYDELHPYHLKDCQDIYSKKYVTKRNFCAGFTSKGGGACNHDVGGPGIYGSKLVGVISFGTPVCGQVDRPTVFTNVGYYASWIDKIMRQKVPTSYAQTTLRDPFRFRYLTESTTVKTTLEQVQPIYGTSNQYEKLAQISAENRDYQEYKKFTNETQADSSITHSIFDSKDSDNDSQYKNENHKEAFRNSSVEPTTIKTHFTETTIRRVKTSKLTTIPMRIYTNIMKEKEETVSSKKIITTTTDANVYTEAIFDDSSDNGKNRYNEDRFYGTVAIEIEKKFLKQGDNMYDVDVEVVDNMYIEEDGMSLESFETKNSR